MKQRAKRKVPIVERVANTPIGRFAEGIHKNTISTWPFGIRMAIAVLWDFVVDTPLRIAAWFIPVPFVVEAIRFPLDVILALGALMLWGSPGLLQTGGIIIGFVPIVGRAVDLLPILTIAGFVARRRGKEDATEHNATLEASHLSLEDSAMMIMVPFLTGLVGLIAGFILWWNGVIDFTSILWTTLCPAGAAFVLRLARSVPVPRGLLVGIGGVAGGLLLIVGVGLGCFSILLPAESYRETAWKEFVDAKDFRIIAATQADKIGKVVDITALEQSAGSLVENARRKLAEKLEGGAQTPEEEEPYAVSVGKWLSRNVIAPKPPDKKMEAQKTKPEPAALKKDIGRLQLGPARASLYRSDFVLKRAEEMRENTVWWFRTAAFWLIGILGFVVTFGLLQNREQNRERIEPTMPF